MNSRTVAVPGAPLRSRAARWLCVVGLAPVLALTACGTTDTSSSPGAHGTDVAPVSAVTAAARDAAKVGSAAFSFSVASSLDGTASKLTGTGAYDTATGSAELSVTVPESLASGLGPMAAVLGTGPIRLVVSDGVAYVRLPGLAGGSWVKVDPSQPPLSDLAAQLAERQAGGASSLLGSKDPVELLEQLSEAVADATVVGTEKVRGIDTTHYRGTVDLAAVAAAAGRPADDAVTAAADPAYDVWVDQDGRVVKLTVQVEIPQGSSASTASGGSVTLTLEQWAFGEPVSVTVPPAGDVVDLAQVLPALPGFPGLTA